MRREADGFRRRYFKHRVAALLLVLLGAVSWRGWIRNHENRPIDWTRPHRVVICPLFAPGTDVATP